MGLTYEQAKSLGIGHLHPDVNPNPKPEARWLLQYNAHLLERREADTPPSSATETDDWTKLERRFRDDVLIPALASPARHITGWWREPIKLRLGGHTFYTPDFLVAEWTGDHGLPPQLVFVEVKGYMREDASVKLKVAAGMFPMFYWLLVKRPGKWWDVREVTDKGIGTDPIRVPWI